MTYTFLLPAYKTRFLNEAIGSILKQTYTDFSLIVIDDASPEDVRGIVAAHNDPRISYRRNEQNIGGKDLVAQWNHCLSFVESDYFVMATDDDVYEKEFLTTLVGLTKKYPDADLFRARVAQVDSNNNLIALDRCYKERLSPTEFTYHMLHGMRGGIPQYMFRSKRLIEKGGFVNFPKAWASDDATALLMAGNGVINSQEHLVRFRYSDINISSDKSCGCEKVKARLMFSKWLNENITLAEGNDEWNKFYKKGINDFLPIYHKTTLIQTLRQLPLSQRWQSLKTIKESKIFTTTDLLSIIRHSMVK